MRRVGKGCSRIETPLFENMLVIREEEAEEEVQVPAHDDVDQENVIEEIADDILTLKARVKKLERLNKVKSSKLRRLKKVSTSQRVESSEDEENVFNQGRISVDIDERIEKRKGVVIRDPKEKLHDDTSAETQSAKDKGKEKTDHNTDFHQILDFLEASHIRIETTNQETKIIATVDGKPWTIFESSLRRHLKLNDEEGISSLPDAELFENLSLMG
nr:hypothetical protein [Tanacetum cinerariifolium]